MGAGLGRVPVDARVFMVITFTGEIDETEAKALNEKLNAVLKEFNDNSALGGTGHVDFNNVEDGSAGWDQ